MASEIAPADLQSMLTKIKNSESLVVSIITHRLPARDLYKLHPPDASEEDLRDASLYKTPSSVLLPLQVYFAILNEYFTGLSYYITQSSVAYREHLQYLIDEYEWPRVLEYHCAYFDRQVFRMRSEALESPIDWLTPDYQLMDQFDPIPEDALAHSKIILPTEMDTENPIQTITVMLRRAMDPFADDGIKYVNYAKHKIVKSLSCHHLPHPFGDVALGWMVLDVGHLCGGADSWSVLPVKDVIKLLSYEGGKYPFLTLVGASDLHVSRLLAEDRRREEAYSGRQAGMVRKSDAKAQRHAERRAYLRSLLLRALGIFKPPSAKSTPPSLYDSTNSDSNDKKELSRV